MNYSAMHSVIFNHTNNRNKNLRWRALKVAFVPCLWKECSVYIHKHNQNNKIWGWRKLFSIRNWLHRTLVILRSDFCSCSEGTGWSGLLEGKNPLRDCGNLERSKSDSWPRDVSRVLRSHTFCLFLVRL